MYQVITSIFVQQIPTDAFPKRNLLLSMSCLVNYEIESTWEQLTQTLKITLPKNIKIKATDVTGNIYSLGSVYTSSSSIGGYVGMDSDIPIPTFLRGDIITFDVGWRAILTGSHGNEVEMMTGQSGANGQNPLPHLFQGFISKVSPRLPFVIEAEDYMWLLKQVPTPTKQWPPSNIPDICTTCINLALNNTAGSILSKYQNQGIAMPQVGNCDNLQLIFNVGNFWTRGEALSQTLARIKHQYHLDSWFVGNILYIGLTHYIPSSIVNNTLTFQQNILDNPKLEFKRKDDTVLSVVVRSTYAIDSGEVRVDGTKILKPTTTEILVYVDKSGAWNYLSKKKGVEYPPQEEGKRFTFLIYSDTIPVNGNVYSADNVQALFAIGKQYLAKYYYDGLAGSFDTFGFPYIKHGDTVTLVHPTLPEMNGVYMVKGVYPYGGADSGLKQTIYLDYRVDNNQPS